MLRFLRTYSRWILAVFGTLLMVVFLIPQAIQGLSQSSALRSSKWATVGPDDQNVSGAELERLRAELQLIEAIGEQTVLSLGANRDVAHWYLLAREAEEAGLVGGRADGRRAIQAMVDQALLQAQAQGTDVSDINDETFLRRIALNTGQSPAFVLDTLGRLNGVTRMIELYRSAGKLSDRRLEDGSARLLLGVNADLVPIEARTLATTSDWTPTESALQTQLDTYGDVIPGEGEFGFGYKLPNRLKLEWMSIPAASVRTALESSPELDNIALRKHRERNRALFPATTTDGSDDFAAVREQVRQHLLTQLLDERLGDVAKFASDQLALAKRGLDRSGPYVEIDESWTEARLGMPELAEAIAAQFNIELPAYQTSGPEWIETSRIDRYPGIGTATTDRFGAQPLRLSAIVNELREFDGSDAIAIQAGVAGPPLRGVNGDIFLYRVIDVDPSRPPASVDEVREQLVADLSAQHAYEQILQDVPALRREAVDEGLVTLAATYQAAVQPAFNLRETDTQMMRLGFQMASPIPVVGQSPETLAAIIDQAATLDPFVAVADQPIEDRTFVIPVDDKLIVLVGRVNGMNPLVAEDYEALAANGLLRRSIKAAEMPQFVRDTFSVDAMIERNNFKLVNPREEDELLDELGDETATS